MPSPEIQEVIDLLRATNRRDEAARATFEESRAALDGFGDLFSPPPGVAIEAGDIAGVPTERYTPGDAREGLVLYHHGGAYTSGSLRSHRALCARIAAACARELVAVDYRLAPEHPYPAGLDDASAVYHDVLAQGTAAEQVILAGDSAGGGLATALLLRLRDNGGSLPAGAVLLSPWLDLTATSDAITSQADDDPMLSADMLHRRARAYAGEDLRQPLVSPHFADPAGLPPLLILVGTAEILLDDSRTFAACASAAGVDVELDVEEDLIHVWPFVDGTPEAQAAMERIGTWVGERLTVSAHD
jgi:acetyl esterase/lipase